MYQGNIRENINTRSLSVKEMVDELGFELPEEISTVQQRNLAPTYIGILQLKIPLFWASKTLGLFEDKEKKMADLALSLVR